MNILITSVSRKIWLIDAFRNALNSIGIGGKIICCDIDIQSAGSFLSDKFYLVPKSEEKAFIPAIEDIIKKEEISLVIPTRDGELLVFSENKKRFNDLGVSVMVSDPSVIKTCLDKYAFFEFLMKQGVESPDTYLPDELTLEEIVYPMLVKNRYGSGSRDVFKVSNEKQLKFFIEYVPDSIVQDFVNGKEYTVDVFLDFQGKLISLVPRERIEIVGGESYRGRTCNDNEIIEKTTELVKHLGVIGHITVQCIKSQEGLKFIEVNPRFGGAANLGFRSGVKTPEFLIKLTNGDKLDSHIGEFENSLVMLRYTRDLFISGGKAV